MRRRDHEIDVENVKKKKSLSSAVDLNQHVECSICRETMTQPVMFATCSHMVCLGCFETMRAQSVTLVQYSHDYLSSPDLIEFNHVPWKYKLITKPVPCPLCKVLTTKDFTFTGVFGMRLVSPPIEYLKIIESVGGVKVSSKCPHCQKVLPNYTTLLQSHLNKCLKRRVNCHYCNQTVTFHSKEDTVDMTRNFRIAMASHLSYNCQALKCSCCCNTGSLDVLVKCYSIHKTIGLMRDQMRLVAANISSMMGIKKPSRDMLKTLQDLKDKLIQLDVLYQTSGVNVDENDNDGIDSDGDDPRNIPNDTIQSGMDVLAQAIDMQENN